jgi:hypothetical protein
MFRNFLARWAEGVFRELSSHKSLDISDRAEAVSGHVLGDKDKQLGIINSVFLLATFTLSSQQQIW